MQIMDRGSSVPLYIQLKELLRDKIESGDLGDGELLPTEQELCEQFNLSRYTVRQALGELVKEGYIERVRGLGSFVRRVPKVANAPAVGIIVPYTDDFYTSSIIRGVEGVARSEGHNLIFANSNNHPEQEETLLRKLRNDGVRGLIIFPCEDSVYSVAVEGLMSIGFPVVLVDREYKTLDCPAVVSDNVDGGEKAVDYLVSLGHKRIAFAMTIFNHTSSVQDRLFGYRTALARHHIPWDKSLLLTYAPRLYDAPEDDADHIAPLRRYLAREDRPTAIFAVNDLVALDILRAAAEVGLDVPGDLSVVGFDDIPVVSELPTPLTTVAQPHLEIGAVGAKMLFHIIAGRTLERTRVVLPVKLVVRQSCSELSQ